MYAYIKGILAEITEDAIIVEHQGIGYETVSYTHLDVYKRQVDNLGRTAKQGIFLRVLSVGNRIVDVYKRQLMKCKIFSNEYGFGSFCIFNQFHPIF